MNAKDIKKLMLWCYNTDRNAFCHVYGYTEPTIYIKEKFSLMQKDPMLWISTLGNESLENLAMLVNKSNF